MKRSGVVWAAFAISLVVVLAAMGWISLTTLRLDRAEAAARGTVVRANVSAVEQILFNLVDNACKYARQAADRRIHLSLRRTGRVVELVVRDHGPGLTGRDQRRLFQPFCKSAGEAARTAPGIGLGLALSRRLARDMGGQLRLDPHVSGGASFVFVLPAMATETGGTAPGTPDG